MKQLTIGLHAEGATDYRFLPAIIRRTAVSLLTQHGATDVAVLDPFLLDTVRGKTYEEKVQEAFRQSTGMHLLILHLDADHRTVQRARSEQFEPAVNAIDASQNSPDAVPLIPVRNIEAWILADSQTFCEKIGTHLTGDELGLPHLPHLVEAIADPKEHFVSAVQRARARRRAHVNPADYYEQLGLGVQLSRLRQVPAYQIFEAELLSSLRRLHFIA